MSDQAGAEEDGRRPARPALVVAGLATVVAGLPLAVALAVSRSPRWYPAMDDALTEMRVRDVGSRHPPLVGLVGHFYAYGQRGSHPGPLSFWLLWPFYELFGRDPWALEAASAVLQAAALTAAVWIGYRRGGRLGALGVAAAVVILAGGYGPQLLLEPWNPYIPLLWWTVFLLAVWSVLCDDLALLPVAVFAGSLCLQTHFSYLGLVGGLGLTLAAVLAVRGLREPERRPALLRWTAGSAALLAVLWALPVFEQLTHHPGNLSVLRENFAQPGTSPTGLDLDSVKIWLAYLDPTGLASASDNAFGVRTGPVLPGLVLLAVWGCAVVAAWRSRQRDVLRLHAVVAVALALGLISISRIIGELVYWLVLWAWGTTLLLVIAIGWTLATSRRTPLGERLLPLARAMALVLAGVLAIGAVRFTVDAAHTELIGASESHILGALVPDTVTALASDESPGGGPDGRYVLRGPQAGILADVPFGLLMELERHGLDVGIPPYRHEWEVPYRWRHPDDATGFIDYVVGQPTIDDWRARDGAVEVASYEADDGGPPIAVFVTSAP